MNKWNQLEKEYCEKELILENCKEKNCILKDIPKEHYIILDGDKMEELEHKSQKNKTADCIIINTVNYPMDIYICELGTSKKFKDVKEKIINSGEKIYNDFKNNQIKIREIHGIYLGKYKNNPSIKQTRSVFSIYNLNNIKIANKPCGSDFNQIINEI